MSMSQGVDGSTIIATRCARLEWATRSQELFLPYDQVRYRLSSTTDGWWQRTLALDPANWLCLSGTHATTPADAFRSLLMERNRPPFSSSLLSMTMFLASTPHPDLVEQRQALGWVTSALPQMLNRLALAPFVVGWEPLSRRSLATLTPILIDALLDPDIVVPWAFQDGVWADVLAHVADSLWQFPSDTTRRIVTDAASHYESQLTNGHSPIDGWAVLGSLSAMRFWRAPWPTIRGLSVQTSLSDLLQLWQQAVIIMHPAAPTIADAQLAWLCDGTVGRQYDGPFDRLRAARPDRVACGDHPHEWQERIAELRNEARRGSCHPNGCWEILVSSDWPIMVAYGIHTMRVVAGRDGCWIRLIPAERSWGSVLWWCPQKHPSAYWPMAFGHAVELPHFHGHIDKPLVSLWAGGGAWHRHDGSLPASSNSKPSGLPRKVASHKRR